MNKILHFLLIAFIVSGCQSRNEKLLDIYQNAITDMQSQLPIQTQFGTMTSVSMSGSKMQGIVTINSPFDKTISQSRTLTSGKLNAIAILTPIKAEMEISDEDIKSTELCAEYIYTDSAGNILTTLTITNDDMQEACRKLDNLKNSQPIYDLDFYLTYIRESNEPYIPMQIDEFTTFTGISIDGYCINFIYTINGVTHDMVTKETTAQVQTLLSESLASVYKDSPALTHDWNLLGLQFNFIYNNPEGNHLFSIPISAKEIDLL